MRFALRLTACRGFHSQHFAPRLGGALFIVQQLFSLNVAEFLRITVNSAKRPAQALGGVRAFRVVRCALHSACQVWELGALFFALSPQSGGAATEFRTVSSLDCRRNVPVSLSFALCMTILLPPEGKQPGGPAVHTQLHTLPIVGFEEEEEDQK